MSDNSPRIDAQNISKKRNQSYFSKKKKKICYQIQAYFGWKWVTHSWTIWGLLLT